MHIDLPQSTLDLFNRTGVFLRIFNAGSAHVRAEQQFDMAGELNSVGFHDVRGDRGLKANFLWLAERTADGWVAVTEEARLGVYFSLNFFSVSKSPRQGELVLEPRVPIAYETWLFYDPKHKVQLPLQRDEILTPAA